MKGQRHVRLAVTGAAIVALGCLPHMSPTRACIAGVSWTADLSAPTSIHSVKPKIVGTATMALNLERPFGLLTVTAPNVHNVQRIELRAVRSRGDLYGPAIATLYAVKDGPFRGKFARFLGPSDIIKQTQLKISTPSDVAIAIYHNSTVVAVCTKSHPRGEIAGVITPHPVEIYTDGPGGFHDPKLHHAALMQRG